MSNTGIKTPPVLVLGAYGLLGSALMETLDGDNFCGLDRDTCDAIDPAQVERAIETHRPEVIINAIGYTDVDGTETAYEDAKLLNADLPGALAKAARKHGCLFVHIGSDYVFDGKSNRPYKEDDATGPVSRYGQTKLDGEKAVMDEGGDWLIVRPAWIFGHVGRDFVHTMLNLAKTHPELRVVDDQTGSPTYTIDLSEGILNLINCEARGIFHFVNSGQATWFDLAKETLALAGYGHVPIKPIPTSEMPRPAQRPAYSVLGNNKYIEATGHTPRTWDLALKAALTREGLIKQ